MGGTLAGEAEHEDLERLPVTLARVGGTLAGALRDLCGRIRRSVPASQGQFHTGQLPPGQSQTLHRLTPWHSRRFSNHRPRIFPILDMILTFSKYFSGPWHRRQCPNKVASSPKNNLNRNRRILNLRSYCFDPLGRNAALSNDYSVSL